MVSSVCCLGHIHFACQDGCVVVTEKCSLLSGPGYIISKSVRLIMGIVVVGPWKLAMLLIFPALCKRFLLQSCC